MANFVNAIGERVMNARYEIARYNGELGTRSLIISTARRTDSRVMYPLKWMSLIWAMCMPSSCEGRLVMGISMRRTSYRKRLAA